MAVTDRPHRCLVCHMPLKSVGSFHPYLACLAFQQTGSTDTVEANLLHVMRYGQRLHAAQVRADVALHDTSALTRAEDHHARLKATRTPGGPSKASGRKAR